MAAQLTESVCKLRFLEHEFVEFFEEVSPLDEDAHSYTYTIPRDGLRLVFTIFPIDGDIYADIFRDGVLRPIVKTRFQGCTHFRFIEFGSIRFLEIGKTKVATSEPTAPISWGVRLAVRPHIKIELIDENG